MSDSLKIQGVVEVVTTDAEAALGKVGVAAEKMAGKVGAAADNAGKSVDGIGSGAGESAEKMTRAEGRMLASIKRVQTQFELAGKSASQALEYKINAKGLDAAKFEPALEKLREIERQSLKASAVVGSSLNTMGISSKQLAASLRGVPAQFTDIITSLQGGQRPLTVLLQQGGQLKDMFGGAGNAVKALGGYVLSLVNPYTIAAGAVAGLGYAYYQGASEAEAFNKSLILTGNTIGKTSGQLMDMANALSKRTGSTQGGITEVLNQIISSGNVAGDMIDKVAKASVDMERAGGPAASEMVKQFAELGKSPLEASKKLNEQYGYLKASVYEQIKALQEQGKTLEAAKVAQEAFYQAAESKAPQMIENLGYVEKSWKAIKDAVMGAGSAIASIGRQSTESELVKKAEDRLAMIKSQIARAQVSGLSDQGALILNAQLESAQKAVDSYKAKEQAASREAKAIAETSAQNKLAAVAIDAVTKTQEKGLSKQEQMNKALAEYKSSLDAIRKANPASALLDSAKIQQGINAIKDQYKERAVAGTKNDISQQYAAQLAAEKEFTTAQVKLIKERVAAGVESEQDGIKEVLAAQISGYAKERELLTAQLAKTADVGDKAKLGQQIASISNGMQVAAAEYVSALAKIEQARQKYMQSQVELSDNAAYKIEQENVALRAQIDVLGMSDIQIGAYESSKIRAAAAAEYLDAANLREAASTMEASGIVSDAIPYYRQLADAREAAGKALDKKALLESEKGMKKAAIDSAKEWQKTADKIGDSITDALMRGFESGKGFAENLRDSIKNTFSTLILRPIVQATVMGGLSAIGIGSAVAADGSSTGGIGDWLSLGNSASSLLGLSGSGAAAGTMAMANLSGVVGGDALGTLIAGNSVGWGVEAGGIAGGSALGAVGAAIPYVGLALSAIALLAGKFGKGGTPHAGGIAFSDGTNVTNPNTIDGILANFSSAKDANNMLETDWTKRYQSGIADALAPTATAIALMLEKTSATFGKDIKYQVGLAFSSDGEDKTRGRLSILNDTTNELLATTRGRYSKDASEGLKEFINATGTGVLSVLESMDLPKWADSILDAIGDAPNIDTMQSVVTQINAIAKAAELLSPAFKMAEDDFASLYLAVGGDTLSKYYDTVFTSAEKQAAQLKQVSEAFDDLGFSLPTSIENFRALVESQDSTTESGRKTIASLMGLTSAFASVQSSIDAVKAAAEAKASAILETQASRISQYLDAQREAQQSAIADQETAYSNIVSSAQSVADVFDGILKSLSEYRKSLMVGNDSTLSPTQKYAEAKSNYEITAAKAKLGDKDAAEQLQAATDAFLSASKAASPDASSYAVDFGISIATLDQVIGTADRRKSIAQQQLEVAQAQLATLQSMALSLSSSTPSGLPTVVDNFAQAAADWQNWFNDVSVGSSVNYAGLGTTTRISADKGIFTDTAGNSYTFSQSGGAYELADKSAAWAAEMVKRYGAYKLPGFAVGTNYIPQDMNVRVHEGEAIIPKPYNPALGGNAELISEIRALRAEVTELRSEQRLGNAVIANNTSKTAKTLDRVMPDGDALNVRVAA